MGLGKVLFANSARSDDRRRRSSGSTNALAAPKKRISGRVAAITAAPGFPASMTGLPANHVDGDLPVGGVLRTDCPSTIWYGLGERKRILDRLVANLEDMIVREGA